MSVQIAPPRISDPTAFGRVAVLMGGTSSEREVSLDSGRNVLAALQARGVDAFAVDGIPALVDAIGAGRSDHAKRVDRVFNILHGNKGGGEDGVLQGLLEALRVPYTGSGVLGSALSMDKIRTKQVWLSLGLPTPRYLRLTKGADVYAAAREIGLPVIIKPSCEGSSVGVSRVHDDAGLEEAVALAARYTQLEDRGDMLMEQLVVGDELTVGVLELGSAADSVQRIALPSIRIVPKGDWYDYNAKYVAEDTQYLCPGLEGEAETEIGRIALAAFVAAGCSGWGRVDVMRDRASGQFYLLEVNTAPGMTSHSLVPKAAREIGIDFEQLCWRVLESSIAIETNPGGTRA